jgi:anti-sigma B factor antagonist
MLPATPRPRRRLRLETSGDATVIRFRDHALNEANAYEIGEELLQVAAELYRPTLRLDMGGVTYLNSTVLGKLLVLLKRLRAAGGELTLYNVEHAVYDLFEVTRLTTVFDVRRRGQEAARP